MPIPHSVTRAELLEALKPLGELLGLDLYAIYPPIIIDHDAVTVDLAPSKTKEQANRSHVEGEAVGVVAHRYSVEVS